MDSTRRRFLKIAGLSVLGLGVKPAMDAVAQSGQPEFVHGPKALTAKRWAMVVDQRNASRPKTGANSA